MTKRIYYLLTTFLLLLPMGLTAASVSKDYAKYVDPLIGSDGHGHVFVGANVPFGAVQLGPMNIYKGWDWVSGYHYSDSIIIGFSHNHLSGTGCSDLGDVSLMPYTGTERTLRGEQNNIKGSVASYFKHSNERVSPGYYAVKMDNGVDVELTSTERVGLHHYIYKEAGTPRVLVDLVNDIDSRVYESYIRKVDDYTIEGYRFVKGWSPLHKTFFYLKTDRPIHALRLYAGDKFVCTDELQTQGVKGVMTFADDTREVNIKVALSSVSCTNARMNMEAEAPVWDFDRVHRAAVEKWNQELACIDIDGTQMQKTIFYTALYHMMIAPNLYCDVNGDFRGIGDKVMTGNQFRNYTIFSTWDTYRTLHPLFTIIKPERVPDMVNSMLSIYDQNGKLPIWPLHAGETNCMPGYSSVPIIADAYLKGIGGFDAHRALDAMIGTATNPAQNGISLLMKYGYIPADSLQEATSISQEYAADDWSIALMAKKMGRMDDYKTFIRRGHAYEHYWDKRINKIHPKMADGSWYEPYDPFSAEHHGNVGDFTEGNGWQYTFMVPQNPDGLVALHGGDEAFVKNLDSLFVAEGDLGAMAAPDVSGLVGQYAHGNEPNHHIPYLYAYAGTQWKTAARVRMLQKEFYTAKPDGLCGNEDCGQMSAWHVMSALGFYQVNPSNGVYVFGSPEYRRASVKLPGGKTFTVVARNNSDRHVYIKSAKLNGKPYTKAFITYQDIMRGGTLEFVMSDRPNKRFGQARAARPKSAE